MNLRVAAIYKDLLEQLSTIYDQSEAESIVNLLLEDLLGITRVQRLTSSNLSLTLQQSETVNLALEQLMRFVPLQHVTGFAAFLGRKFKVNKHVLIPRPETEELVHLIYNNHQKQKGLHVLDIGTGSGCIPVSLALMLDQPQVESWDISSEAIQVAEQNALKLGANVKFTKRDVLTTDFSDSFDIIVSNPPYIPHNESVAMHPNVTRHEPALALFVSDDDPLIFYHKIANGGTKSLSEGGLLYFEIHELFADQTSKLLIELGYQEVTVHRDLNDKQRMVSARWFRPQ